MRTRRLSPARRDKTGAVLAALKLTAADETADFIERAGREFVAAPIEVLQFDREPKEEPQFLDTEIRSRQQRTAIPCVGRFHKRFEHVERRGLNPIAEQELLAARKFLDRANEPENELKCASRAGPVICAASAIEQTEKTSPGAAPLDPRLATLLGSSDHVRT